VRSHDQPFIILRVNNLAGKTNTPIACSMYRFNIIVACSPLFSLFTDSAIEPDATTVAPNGAHRSNVCNVNGLITRCIVGLLSVLPN